MDATTPISTVLEEVSQSIDFAISELSHHRLNCTPVSDLLVELANYDAENEEYHKEIGVKEGEQIKDCIIEAHKVLGNVVKHLESLHTFEIDLNRAQVKEILDKMKKALD